MENVSLPEVFSLPVDERLRIVQAIWDSVADHPETVPLTAVHRAELDKAYTEYLADPNEGSPWSEVKARLLSRE